MNQKYKHPPCIIDIEASGFGSHSYPIEIGVIDEYGERFCKLIAPFDDWVHWDQAAEDLHGISKQTLHDNGVPGVEICLELNALFAKKTLYSDAWSVDAVWLNKLFDRAGVTKAFSVSALEMIMTESQIDKWDFAKQAFIKQSGIQRHRASSDAFIIQETFLSTTK
ncbi:hypothetical protein [Glaciecola sp. KUL10]|uniref:hypothetical protein n=1 Tax=Glaciecola sp. (strain KUL10) TaxID=2161813 RepID=UPI000D78856F|nr:hypothetical protein [Glaciecola sp. KUL10]GBL02734.1 hypothetical protein KUL10_00070 [Glaciecola sp. KUL10]